MIISRGWLHATTLIGLSVVLAPSAVSASAAPVLAVGDALAQYRALPEPPAAGVARTELADLKVEAAHRAVKRKLKTLQYRPEVINGCLTATGLTL